MIVAEMVNDMKVCKQCGLQKDEQAFRPLYGKQGTYNVCLDCERINSRHKYLSRKGTLTANELAELRAIDDLYARQRDMGLKPPKRRNTTYSTVSRLVDMYNAEAQRWLTAELTEKPEYYIDEVFETLRGADKELRDKVLERFYDYEDQYYGGNKDA